jgi:hypothetical protein
MLLTSASRLIPFAAKEIKAIKGITLCCAAHFQWQAFDLLSLAGG